MSHRRSQIKSDRQNPHRFSIKHYSRTLKHYLEAGYTVVPFSAIGTVSTSKVLVLRHDVDISLEYVAPVLAAESELGVRSTVFVRTSALGYSLDDPATASAVRRMADGGFEVGLHYEFGADARNDRIDLQRQKQALEQCLGKPVPGAAPHRVAIAKREPPVETIKSIGFEYDAFEPRFTREFKYISDSRRRWREGCFCSWIDAAERLQVLTHPVWWQPGSLKRMHEILRLL
jgi:hypothetical protein